MLKEDYKNLSTAEKIILVEEIWDSINEEAEFKLTTEQKKMLEKRATDILEGRVKTKSWEEIKAGVKKRRKK